MGTLFRTHRRLELLHLGHRVAERCGVYRSPKLQDCGTGVLPRKPYKKWAMRSSAARATSNALLEFVPRIKKENLEFDLPSYDPSKGLTLDLAVIGGGPVGLAVAQQVSETGLFVCSSDPSPRLVWPNNCGLWVEEFEAMGLLDCLDATWPGAVVYVNDRRKRILGRPYGRVNRKQVKSKIMQTSRMVFDSTRPRSSRSSTRRRNRC
ncbi:unnamed protein product [Musa hybrid cultivar]